MSDRDTAEIIRFPRQNPAADDLAAAGPAGAGQTPLEQALARLQRALADQASAVACWQDAIGALHGQVSELGVSMARYETGLLALGEGVATLQDAAGKLDAWADTVLLP